MKQCPEAGPGVSNHVEGMKGVGYKHLFTTIPLYSSILSAITQL